MTSYQSTLIIYMKQKDIVRVIVQVTALQNVFTFFFICFQFRWMIIGARYITIQQDHMNQVENFFFDRFRQNLNMTEYYINPFNVAVAPFFFSLGPVEGYNDRLNPLLRTPCFSVPDHQSFSIWLTSSCARKASSNCMVAG